MDVDEFHKHLGRAIASRRKAARITQERLAELVDSSPEWLSQVERGVGAPSMALVFRIAEAIDVPPQKLLLGGLDAPAESTTATEIRTMTERLPEPALRVMLATGYALEDAFRDVRD